jgi:predicted DNA-binding transcriptional regulator AlpA
MGRLLRFPQLKSEKGISFSRQHISELVRQKKFPGPVKTPDGGQFSFWVEDEIDGYIETLKSARDTAPPDEVAARRVAAMMAGREAKKKSQKPAGTVVIQRRKRRVSNE